MHTSNRVPKSVDVVSLLDNLLALHLGSDLALCVRSVGDLYIERLISSSPDSSCCIPPSYSRQRTKIYSDLLLRFSPLRYLLLGKRVVKINISLILVFRCLGRCFMLLLPQSECCCTTKVKSSIKVLDCLTLNDGGAPSSLGWTKSNPRRVALWRGKITVCLERYYLLCFPSDTTNT